MQCKLAQPLTSVEILVEFIGVGRIKGRKKEDKMFLYWKVMQTSEDPNLIPTSPGKGVHSALSRNFDLSTGALFLLEMCSILETISVIWGKCGSLRSKAEHIRMWHLHVSKIMFKYCSLDDFKKFWKL